MRGHVLLLVVVCVYAAVLLLFDAVGYLFTSMATTHVWLAVVERIYRLNEY